MGKGNKYSESLWRVEAVTAPTTEVGEAAYAAGREVRSSTIQLDLRKANEAGYNIADVAHTGDKLTFRVEQVGPFTPMFSTDYADYLAKLLGPDDAEAILGAAHAKITRQVFLSLLSK